MPKKLARTLMILSLFPSIVYSAEGYTGVFQENLPWIQPEFSQSVVSYQSDFEAPSTDVAGGPSLFETMFQSKAAETRLAPSQLELESVVFRGQSPDSLEFENALCTDTCCPSTCESVLCNNCAADSQWGNFRISEVNSYYTASYQGSKSASFGEFEIASKFDMGPFKVDNRTVMNVADLPSTIVMGPTNPNLDPLGAGGSQSGTRSNGFGDILTATFFSLRDHEVNYELGIGPVFTFPTASNSGLGSDVYTVGPGVHFLTEFEKLTVGLYMWQSWSFGGPDKASVVNQLTGKPFLLYEICEDLELIYIPLGLSLGWKKPSGKRTTVPLGGGLRKLIDCGDHKLGLSTQAFSYVAQKKGDPEWEIRFTVELLFDE